MKDFGQWFKEQKPVDLEKIERDAHIAALEDAGVIEQTESGFTAECYCCGARTGLPVGPEEIDLDYVHYCGGSDRCVP